MDEILEELLDGIKYEFEIQEREKGINHHDSFVWLAFLVEEVGEVAKSVVENDQIGLELELVQTCVAVLAWLKDREIQKEFEND